MSTEADFAELVATLDYPMFVVTTVADGTPAGCLIGFATQCSIDPPRYLVALSDKNLTYRVALRSSVVAVHFVPQDALELAELFGSETGDDTDKFERWRWRPGPGGVPILEGCPRWFAGRILERIPFGDHVGHVLEPIDVASGGDGPLLSFQRTRHLEPGHEA